jgi:hypothetical protein
VQAAQVSVNSETKVVTFVSPDGTSPAAQWADGTGAGVNAAPTTYSVYLSGSRNQWPHGLDSIISLSNPPGGAYGGIDRTVATNQFWQSNVMSNGGVARALTLELIDEMDEKIKNRGPGKPNLYITNPVQIRRLKSELVLRKRFDGAATKINGWCHTIMINDTPCVGDKMCDPAKFYMVDTTRIEMYQTKEGEWADDDGSILSRVPGQDRFGAYWRRYCQVIADCCNAHGAINDLDTNPVAA